MNVIQLVAKTTRSKLHNTRCQQFASCGSPTGTISNWLNVVGVFSRRLSSFLMHVHTVGHSAVFFGVTTVNVFSSVNKMMLMSLDDYFSAMVSNSWVCIAVRSLHSVGYWSTEHDSFWAETFHNESMAAWLVPWRLRLFHPVLIMLTLSYTVRRWRI